MVPRCSHLPLLCLPSYRNIVGNFQMVYLVPMITDNLPAPLALAEKSTCDCKKECLRNIPANIYLFKINNRKTSVFGPPASAGRVL